MNTLRDRLKEARKEAGYTQDTASDKLFISRAYLAHLESGIKNPSDRLLENMSKLYNVNSMWLKSGIGSKWDTDDEKDIALADIVNNPDKLIYKKMLDIAKAYQMLSVQNQKVIDEFIESISKHDE